MQEMKDALLLESDQPVLAQGSTRMARKLTNSLLLGSALRDGSLTQFDDLKLAHTCVRRKPPRP